MNGLRDKTIHSTPHYSEPCLKGTTAEAKILSLFARSLLYAGYVYEALARKDALWEKVLSAVGRCLL